MYNNIRTEQLVQVLLLTSSNNYENNYIIYRKKSFGSFFVYEIIQNRNFIVLYTKIYPKIIDLHLCL